MNNINTFLAKFSKGFLFAGIGSFIAVLESSGCNVHSVADLKALGLAALSGVIAGLGHAFWNAYQNRNVQS